MLLILGPCAAETYDRVMTTARLLAEQSCGGHHLIYRAGVWKPRTSPDTFQGVGQEALSWLAEVKRTYGMPVATEVAMPEHVRLAMEAGIDYLWIGARTSANPIAVQAIADALTGVGSGPEKANSQQPTANSQQPKANSQQPKAVLIKNPVNEDAELWLGNIARLEQAGVPVIAVHRGCGHRPCWGMAHRVRMARPDIPMLLDPSHLTGDRDRIPEAMQKVTELGLDGAMIEVHCCPEQALSDARQQLTPAACHKLIANSQQPTANSQQLTSHSLAWYRAEIDELDDQLWNTLLRRLEVCERIGAWKHAHDIAPLQPERFEQIVRDRVQWGSAHDITPEHIRTILTAIHAESLRRQ